VNIGSLVDKQVAVPEFEHLCASTIHCESLFYCKVGTTISKLSPYVLVISTGHWFSKLSMLQNHLECFLKNAVPRLYSKLNE
jgi:hypothetical protein